MANVTQTFVDCTMVYDLTGHSITVTDNMRNTLLLKVWRIPDNPGGFDLATDGHSIDIGNPTGLDFVGVTDNYDDQTSEP